MELRKVADTPCPTDVIALAINNDNGRPHCGIVYTDAVGAVRLCDMRFEHCLSVGQLPNDFFWTRVRIDDTEAIQIAVFIEFIITREKQDPLPYSFVYSPNAFDVTGSIRKGTGLTCATFVVGIFDQFKLHVVEVATWRERPMQDAAFRERIIELARSDRYPGLAARLRREPKGFRLKPSELFGSATHKRYPVKFEQATKLAKTVRKLVRKYSRPCSAKS
jgi:hypothetical protein